PARPGAGGDRASHCALLVAGPGEPGPVAHQPPEPTARVAADRTAAAFLSHRLGPLPLALYRPVFVRIVDGRHSDGPLRPADRRPGGVDGGHRRCTTGPVHRPSVGAVGDSTGIRIGDRRMAG